MLVEEEAFVVVVVVVVVAVGNFVILARILIKCCGMGGKSLSLDR